MTRSIGFSAASSMAPSLASDAEVATPILFETLNEIRAVVADRIERGRAETAAARE